MLDDSWQYVRDDELYTLVVIGVAGVAVTGLAVVTIAAVGSWVSIWGCLMGFGLMNWHTGNLIYETHKRGWWCTSVVDI